MPVYLCQPGQNRSEPWRHGVQVYAAPFDITDDTQPAVSGGRDLVVASWKSLQSSPSEAATSAAAEGAEEPSPLPPAFVPHSQQQQQHQQPPIRRVRHAEIVIVDDVCIAYGRYWLRLRWPGHKAGFAGYIAMGKVDEAKQALPASISDTIKDYEDTAAEEDIQEEADNEDAPPEEGQETASMPSSEPFETPDEAMVCLRTGLAFQSSQVMKLMAFYDDGVTPTVSLAPAPTEPVFCRICREGLHEDADEDQPAAEGENEQEDLTHRDVSSGDLDDPIEPHAVDPIDVSTITTTQNGPVTPHPAYTANQHALENPMLAPCECSGSMAFVHYLCVEQWRCRSRHPDAHHGLACETCGTNYSLPPPSARPAAPVMDQEDWLDAMPPHVMQALRQPHICWQIGAAVVRRRWLRPIAPVLMSPLVALYCRARRLLKKRGVARRRWACSLCRRRARWKCVRCLRSYYCSRQCQNVSWHIVHKHVCYKPARFWWSVVVYGVLTLLLFPGIVRDPLMYDLGLCLIPVSFVLMGIMGGAMAITLKRFAGIDLRGRLLEGAVVVWTLWLTIVSWGLVKGFFGDPSACHGALGSYNVSEEGLASTYMLLGLRTALLQPAQAYYLMWDRLALMTGPWLRAALCTRGNGEQEGCFQHLPHANADFVLEENGGGRCAADLLLVSWLYIAAGFAFVGSAVLKRQERQQRRVGVRRRGEPRLHQD